MRIGVIEEGSIGDAILEGIINNIFEDTTGKTQRQLTEIFPQRKRGAGGVVDHIVKLVRLFDSTENRCDFYCIVIDSRKSEFEQNKIRAEIANATDDIYVFGVAIQEIEAWVLGDKNTLFDFLGIDYRELETQPEKDADPKSTLSDMIVESSKGYYSWNRSIAIEVAEFLRPEKIKLNCPKGFAPFHKEVKKKIKQIYNIN